MTLNEMAQEFGDIFAGLTRAYGIFRTSPQENDPSSSGKVSGKGQTVHKGPTILEWRRHLSGEQRLGIFPLRDDGTVNWAVIDVDDYEAPHEIIVNQIKTIPLVPIRSKSGGLHLFMFFARPRAASAVRFKMSQLAGILGFQGAEVFPKQGKLITAKGDVGNWLNMPYFGGFNSSSCPSYAYDDNSNRLSAPQFLELVAELKRSQPALSDIKLEPVGGAAEVKDGPPCLQHLITYGIREGSRNTFLFSLGVYYQRAYPDEWQTKLEHANENFLDPKLSVTELSDTILKSLARKDYKYKCSEEPLLSQCNKRACCKQKHGLRGPESNLPEISALTKIKSNPPQFFVCIEGQRIGPLDTAEILTFALFRKAVFEHTSRVMPLLKEALWAPILHDLSEKSTEHDAAEDASEDGVLMFYLSQFTDESYAREDKGQLLVGGVWIDLDNKCRKFRLMDFRKFMETRGQRGFSPQRISAIFHKHKIANERIGIKGHRGSLTVWSIPEPEEPVPLVQNDVGEVPF